MDIKPKHPWRWAFFIFIIVSPVVIGSFGVMKESFPEAVPYLFWSTVGPIGANPVEIV